jgi:hypothetical protein
LFTNGEKVKRTLKTPFLAINAKGGESISPKQKDRTTTLTSKKIRNKVVFNGIFEISIPLRNSILNGIYILWKSFSKKKWYLKYLIFFQFVKPS